MLKQHKSPYNIILYNKDCTVVNLTLNYAVSLCYVLTRLIVCIWYMEGSSISIRSMHNTQ